MGVREIPSLLNDHSAHARPSQVAKFAPGGTASDDEVGLEVEEHGEDVEGHVGEEEDDEPVEALSTTTAVPDGNRPAD